MTEAKQVLVPFAGTQIMVIDDGASRPVPMKELVEGIKTNDGSKLDWVAMRRLIVRDKVLSSVMVITSITAKDGKSYQSLTLPMNYLPGFFFKINLSHYKGEIAQMLENYQRNCYNVLYQYFSKGFVFTFQGFKNWLGSLNLMERMKLLNTMIVWIQETIIPKAIREGVDVEGMTAVSAYVADRRGKKPNDFKEMAVTELEQEGVIPTGVGGNILKIDEILENVKFVTKSHMDEIRDYMSNEIIDGLCNSIANKWVSDRVKSVLTGWYFDEANAYMPAVQSETLRFLKPYASNVCRDVLRRADELKHGK